MSYGKRVMTDMEIYNDLPVVEPMKSVWMIDNQLYKKYSHDKAAGIVILTNRHDNKLYTMLISDFMKNRKNVYPLTKTSDLLNRHHTWLRKQIWYGVFPPPTWFTPDGRRPYETFGTGVRSRSPVYTQDQVFELRDIMVERRKYGKDMVGQQKSIFIPSIQELRRRMGLDMLTYTKMPDGTFIPVWQETV